MLRDVNLSVFEGEYLGLVGESGCGKSLTMKSIFGMIDIDPGIVNGKISINDSNKNYLFELKDKRKFDYETLKHLNKERYIKKIRV